jgi:predicted flap endonuclease-1-like 5' DNA nuclease
MTQKTVTIKGTIYDAHTGMPIGNAIEGGKPQSTTSHASQSVHTTTQKSQTLNRRIVAPSATHHQHKHVDQPSHQTIRRSPAITRFAPHPAGALHATPAAKETRDIAPTTHHPIAAKLHQHTQKGAVRSATAKQVLAPKPSQVIKEEAIAKALDQAPKHSSQTQQIHQPNKFQRISGIGAVSLALLLLGGYFTYLNMPSLSVRVAAAEAGVSASYPSYHPDGYSLSGAVAYSQDEVNMKFASNSGSQNFTLAQKKSAWDSTAVLENYVKAKAGNNYVTYNENGLTIYTYDSNAAWVNNGVLYTINGDAPLTSDQIRHIAISM